MEPPDRKAILGTFVSHYELTKILRHVYTRVLLLSYVNFP